MRRRSMLAALGATPFTALASGKLRVIASFSILADMARQVGGDGVLVEALVGPDGDVHVYDPRPKDLRMLMAAGVLVRNGLGLEGWMDRLAAAASFNGVSVVAAERVAHRTMKADGAAIAIDPHAWQNPLNGIHYVQAIAQGLASADPANAASYRQAATRYSGQIAEMDTWIEAKFAAIPVNRRRVITTHDAFGYYSARYAVEFLSAEGISTEFEPSAKSIAALVRQIKRENVRTVFIENMTNPRLAQTLARESGAVLGETVFSDALSPVGGPAPTYLEMFRHNTMAFVSSMTR